MIINIGDDILRLQSLKLLKKLLVDKTTKKNICGRRTPTKERAAIMNATRK